MIPIETNWKVSGMDMVVNVMWRLLDVQVVARAGP